MGEVYYFGVWDRPGHYLHKPGGVYARSEEHVVYFDGVVSGPGGPRAGRRHLDGTLAPRRTLSKSPIVSCEAAGLLKHASEECPQGQFLRHDLSNGYTAIQWWDRVQGDGRYGCNSTLLARGEFTSREMLAMLSEHFGSRLARLDEAGVSLVEVTPG